MVKELSELLKNNSYPGRGIVVGKSEDGAKAMFAYFIMGRSENSRNRVFVKAGDEVKTQPYDAKKVKDPSLIIYSPVKVVGNATIVSNGDQTDTIEEYLKKGVCFRRGLQQRQFEPDAPNFTPRISAVLSTDGGFSYEMSILKCGDKEGKACDRSFYLYTPVSGKGHFLHTYQGDGDPLPSFEGEPVPVRIGNDLKTFAEEIWAGLDPSNKISLYCRAIDLATGAYEDVLFNAREEEVKA